MIQIESVEILNFKSIVEYTFNFNSVNIDNAKCGIFIGLNESGKSAFLEAMSLIHNGFQKDTYNQLCNISAQENSEYVEMYINYKVTDSDSLIKSALSTKILDATLIKKIKIKKIRRNIYLNDDNEPKDTLEIEFDNIDIDFQEYYINQVEETIGSIIYKGGAVSKNFIEGQESKRATQEDVLLILKYFIKSKVRSQTPKVNLWKSSSEFLINEEIDLAEFKENPDISVPLKNIFNVYGKITKSDIKATIDKALKSPAKRDELVEKISEAITKHINKIWKEHKIKIRVSINGEKCNVLVEDKDNKFSYFSMNQRSDGFKQFVSLILSLSALNESNTLKNNIILIDEPEVHLHPSGIIYMRDELLKIAKNNFVLISTHSQFMVDTKNSERQFLVTKTKGETNIQQVNESTNFKDDSVLKSAFGLNLFKELLPEKILIVEGGDDKQLFNHCLNLFNFKNFAIKSAGGASKTPTFAGLLSSEDLAPYIILDSDKEGKDNKKKIIETYKQSYSNKNVMTLKDISNSLPENATIEDLYPVEFVKSFLHVSYEIDLEISETSAVIIQIKNNNESLRNDKQKLEALKVKLSKAFTQEYNTLEKLNTCSILSSFVTEMISKLSI